MADTTDGLGGAGGEAAGPSGSGGTASDGAGSVGGASNTAAGGGGGGGVGAAGGAGGVSIGGRPVPAGGAAGSSGGGAGVVGGAGELDSSGGPGGGGGGGGATKVVGAQVNVAAGVADTGGAGGAGGPGGGFVGIGSNGLGSGGGGGAGGFGVVSMDPAFGFNTVAATATVTGGRGGDGGQAGSATGGQTGQGAGGAGGEGGVGFLLTASGGSQNVFNSGTLKGGAGGAGGAGATPGAGGNGGEGFVANGQSGKLVNIHNQQSGVIVGGAGGVGGDNGQGNLGASGVDGAGIEGSYIAIVNAGTIAGGGSGNAITFTGGQNILEMNGGTLTGNIGLNGGDMQIALLNAGDPTLSNKITGTGAVTINTGAVVTLGGANTYSGGTILQSGAVSLGNSNALGTNVLTFQAATRLEAAFTGALPNGVTINTGVSATIGATSGHDLTLGTGVLDFAEGLSATLHFGTATDTGAVTIALAANVATTSLLDIVAGGAFSVDGGTLAVGNASSAGLLSLFGSAAIGAGLAPATFDLAGVSTDLRKLSGASDGIITDNGAAATLTDVASNETFSGTIDDGSGALALAVGNGSLTLAGANTYSGGSTLNAAAALTLTTSQGAGTGGIAFNGAATLTLEAAITNTISGFGGSDKIDLAYVTYAAGDKLVLQSTHGNVQTFEVETAANAPLTTLNFATGTTASVSNDGTGHVVVSEQPTITALSGIAQIRSPFTGLLVADPKAGGTDTLTLTLSRAANGVLSNLGGGTYDAGNGVYTFTGSAAAVTTALQGLVFTPAPGGPDSTTFDLVDSDGALTSTHFGLSIAYAAAASDFDGDSVANVLLRNTSGSFADWTMSGAAVTASALLTSNGTAANLPTTWAVNGIGDLNDDGKADVLLRNTNGTFADWTMNGSQIASSQLLTSQGATETLPAAWNVSGLGDFNGDGDADVLLRNANGTFADWSMNGSQIASSQLLTSQSATVTLGSAWSVNGFGDFNGDGKSDVLLRNTNGTFADWTMNGSQIESSQLVTSQNATVALGAAWSVVGTGDFNGDGLADVLLRNSNGNFADWTMNGSQIESSTLLTHNGANATLDSSWSIAALGDFTGDGKSDILFRNASGAFQEWTMNGATVAAQTNVTANGNPVAVAAWQAQGGPADLSFG